MRRQQHHKTTDRGRDRTQGTLPAIAGMLNQAVQHHQTGALADAERLYRQILELDARNPDALHLLGVIAHQVGEQAAAHDLIGQAIRIKGNVAFYHNSMGNVLLALGKTADAVQAYEGALTIDPDYAEAHLNMGNIFRDQGKLLKAVARYECALALKPDYAVAHMNLGNVMLDQGKTGDAIERYERAIALVPEYVEAYNNMGLAFMAKGRIDEAMACFERAIAIKPNYEEARDHLSLMHFTETPVTEWGKVCRQYLVQTTLSKKYQHELYVRLSIHHWATGDFVRLRETLAACDAIAEVKSSTNKNVINMRTYEKFLNELLSCHASLGGAQEANAGNEIALIGDSHCLSFANTALNLDSIAHKIVPHLIVGCKAWHLSKHDLNQYQWSLNAVLERLPPRTKCMVCFGEIDCRYNEGIIGHYKKHGGSLQDIISSFVQSYVQNVVMAMRERQLDILFLNVPAPNINGLRKSHKDFTPQEEGLLIEVIRLFNAELSREVANNGCRIIDVYGLTAGPNGKADGAHHIDEHHLKPDVLGLAAGFSPSGNALHT